MRATVHVVRALRLAALVVILGAPTLRATANEGGLMLRPVLGIAPFVSARGAGLGVHIGARIDWFILRASLDVGHMGADTTGTNTAFAIWAARGDVVVWRQGWVAAIVGAGAGRLDYGRLYDKAYDAPVLLPEAGLLLGGERWFGRILVTVTGVVPLRDPRVPGSSIAYQPPLAMLALVLSL